MSPVPRLLPFLLAVPLLLPSSASAHRLDECLQATIVAIEPGDVRLRINVTPGEAVAEPIVSLIDLDRDGTISTAEASAYAGMVTRDLTLRLDGRDVALNLVACDAAAPAELRTGTGIIRVELSAPPGTLAPGAHRLSLENRHLPPVSVYLFNAARPTSASVQIDQQTRNDNQSLGEIEFTIRPSATSFASLATVAPVASLPVVVLAGLWWVRRRGSRAIRVPGASHDPLPG